MSVTYGTSELPAALSALPPRPLHSVITTTGSTQNLGQLFDAPDIAAHVRQVAYLGTGADRMGSTLMYGYGPQFGSDSGALAFQSLALQPSILGALAPSFDIRVSPKLTSLSLHNLRIWELSPLESPPFQTALTTLRCFQLSLLLDGPPAAEIYDPWCNLWGSAYVDASSRLSFAALHFPRLSTLPEKARLEPSVRAQNFILRHAPTLACLELLLCKLPIDTSIYIMPSPSSSTALTLDEEPSSGPDTWERV
ncbi:hypothetical protein EDB84DRAFT_1564892 [Lactarius hengduanensis]|nr:hypothetical protein EDB84DRAFT_1564892 [Lactarius hengduanensis]